MNKMFVLSFLLGGNSKLLVTLCSSLCLCAITIYSMKFELIEFARAQSTCDYLNCRHGPRHRDPLTVYDQFQLAFIRLDSH